MLSYIALGLVVVGIVAIALELRAMRRLRRKIEEQHEAMLAYAAYQYGDESVKALIAPRLPQGTI